MNYYFLAASLPMLVLGEEPPYTSAEFRQVCMDNLVTRDMQALRELDAPVASAAHDPFVSAWRDRETCLRNCVAAARGARLHADPSPYLRETQSFDVDTERRVNDLFSGGRSPLDRERGLDELRWQQLDELAGLNPFSREAILAYYLKLRIAERWAGLDPERGAEAAQELVVASPEQDEDTPQNDSQP